MVVTGPAMGPLLFGGPASIRGPMTRRLAALALAIPFALLNAACDRAQPSVSDAAVFAAATAALDKRLAAVRDYSFEGTAKIVGAAELPIAYAFMQPQFAKGTLGTDQTVVFDGTTILALDHAGKTFAKVDRSVGDEQFLLALHNAFSEFACEGWRPPLIKPNGTVAQVSPDGSQWILTTALADDELKEDQLVLRALDGAFVEKRTLDKKGNVVASTRVLEELDDPATGMKLPKRWVRKGPAGALEIALTKASVNAGIAREAFLATVPEGYNPGS